MFESHLSRWSDVQRLVLGDAARMVAVGLMLGVGTALAVRHVLNGMLFGVTSTDSTTYVAVACAVALTAFAACEVPAMRATRVDPVQALRSE